MKWKVWSAITCLTVAGALVLGYHPYAEDGGIYLAEIKHAVNAGSYPYGAEFVAGHLGGVPGFADAIAWLAGAMGWRLEWVMALLQLACLWGVLAGSWLLVARCYSGPAARWGAMVVVSLSWSIAVAGTSLMLVDPYATARSAAFALTVLGLAGVAAFVVDQNGWGLVGSVAAFCLAGVAHPLMGGYGVGEAIVFGCLVSGRREVRILGVVGAVAVAGLASGLVQALASAETAGYRRVALTRYYWFLGEWRWYELVGLIAPLGILAWSGWRLAGTARGLAWMGVVIGGTSLSVAGCFAREGSGTYAVARLQPLRCFQMVYLVLLIVLGAWLGDRVLRRSAWRWGVAAVGLGGLMGFIQRETYPASGHLELPGVRVVNRWEEAFLWVRDNTPRDALFGLDADYIHRGGEDAQGFRALAERSALPDYSKDGGQAAIRPELTEAWEMGQKAQAGLTDETDAERVDKLGPLRVTWLVMGREARTSFVCPYENEVVKVCRLRP